jgi:hypothetical protein
VAVVVDVSDKTVGLAGDSVVHELGTADIAGDV